MPKKNKTTAGKNNKIVLKRRLIDKETEDTQLLTEFPTHLGRKSALVDPSEFSRPTELARKLNDAGCSISAKDLANDIKQLKPQRELNVLLTTCRPGWHDNLYVLPDWTYRQKGDDSNLLTFNGNSSEQTPKKSGSLETLVKELRKLFRHSSYLAIAIMIALAAPLACRANLKKGLVVVISGESSTGKTTLLLTMTSLVRRAKSEADLQTANLTDARSDNLFETFGGQTICFGDPKAARGGQVAFVKLIHKAMFVQDGSNRETAIGQTGKEREFSVLVVATENPIVDLLQRSDIEVEGGELARVMSIPVPTNDEGGIFDQVGSEKSARKIVKLQKLISKNFGLLMPVWIKFLAEQNSDTLLPKSSKTKPDNL